MLNTISKTDRESLHKLCGCYNTSHNIEEDIGIFKSFGNEETGFLPYLKIGVSALTIL